MYNVKRSLAHVLSVYLKFCMSNQSLMMLSVPLALCSFRFITNLTLSRYANGVEHCVNIDL